MKALQRILSLGQEWWKLSPRKYAVVSSELQMRLKTILAWALFSFILVNGCSWMPGYGGRHDRQPGMEVERYFGWPACFRAELWRSDHPHQVNDGAYIPPIPLSTEMYFVYSSNGLIPFILDAALVAAVAAICGLFVWADVRGRTASWMIFTGVFLAVVVWLIVQFADETSAYL